MKRVFTPLIFIFLITGLLQGQILFQKDFNDNTMAPMKVYNLDGLTPAPQVNLINDAWVVLGNTNPGAYSTSYYTSPGMADDWMVTPAIDLDANLSNVVLDWDARALDASFADGYQVYVSTTGDMPTDFTELLWETTGEATGELFPRGVVLNDYIGQTIYLAFRNNSFDKFALIVDNIVVEANIDDHEVILNDVLIPNEFVLTNTDVNVQGVIFNDGAETITQFDVTWTEGASTYTETLTGLNIPYRTEYTFAHPTAMSTPDARNYKLDVSIANPNGVMDADPSNNDGNKQLFAVGTSAKKRVVFEEGTGTWCGWCPRGNVVVEQMHQTFGDDFIPIAVHNGDPMVEADYDLSYRDSEHYTGGYPGAILDRTRGVSVGNANINDVQAQLMEVAPALVSQDIVYDTSQNRLVANVSVEFHGDFTDADIRLAYVITEDSVHGTGPGWEQANYYSFQTNNSPLVGAGFDWQAETDPVSADKMYYMEVARALIGGWDGMASTVPTTVTNGQVVEYQFDYEIPADQNPAFLKGVAMLIETESGRLMNATSSTLGSAPISGIETIEGVVEMNIYPNPTADNAVLEYAFENAKDIIIKIIGADGKVYSTQRIEGAIKGNANLDASTLTAGTYFVQVSSEGQTITKPLIRQ